MNMRQHTILWELQKPGGPPIDCEAWPESGTVRVFVKLSGQPELTGMFPDYADAVRWATGLERTLVAGGWEKVIQEGGVSPTQRPFTS